ncbi:MAG TPA: DUF2403 domain-containing lipoprotein [Polyangiaceae bacterium]|nr:DUF2403 domain-containing lipoprotein [Polyangiaceae bacterium]
MNSSTTSARGGTSDGTAPAQGGTRPESLGGRPTSGGAPGRGGTSAAAGTNSDAGHGSAAGASGGSAPQPDPSALGAYPIKDSPLTRGGTMTFTNIGAEGWWPRRIDRAAGDPACDYKDGTDTWGGHCCMKKHATASDELSPFDQEMTLIFKAIDIKQLAVYQPASPGVDYTRVSAWDARRGNDADNLWFTQQGEGSALFPGNLTHNDCVGYVMQQPSFECGDGKDYFCPNDPGVLHRGFSGSKLVVFLGSMSFSDGTVQACNGEGTGHPGPWVAFVASELVRDGGRKWNGACNCYSKTGSVGDGCGEINVFEVVMDNNDFSNREFASTGVRSFQAGHVGGAVCGSECRREQFASDADVVDACAHAAYSRGPEIVAGGKTDGCPVWRRPEGDRYFFILLDQVTRTIQVGMVHPKAIPAALGAWLPELPNRVNRSDIDALAKLRLPSGG